MNPKSDNPGCLVDAPGRLRTLIARAGGLLPHERECPNCGGRIVLRDDQARDIPLCSRQYRYDLGCRDNDCAAACGPSVRWVVREWRNIVAEAQQPTAASQLSPESEAKGC